MPLSLDAIRNFGGNDRLLVDARTGNVQAENKLQRFKSFFDVGDARAKNAETLAMIHNAILNDPRFASRDLQSAAVRMLAQVRTDRALGAAQLRGIADELFRLSGEGAGNGIDAVIRERVALHLAARGLPRFRGRSERSWTFPTFRRRNVADGSSGYRAAASPSRAFRAPRHAIAGGGGILRESTAASPPPPAPTASARESATRSESLCQRVMPQFHRA